MRSPNSPFSRVLEEIDLHGEPSECPGSSPRALNPLACAAPPICAGAAPTAHVVEHWEQAMDWLSDAADAADPVHGGIAPSADPGVILEELQLRRSLTVEQLRRARRAFMWRNHPDRCPHLPRNLADRRVAIANMLIDSAIQARSAKE